MPFPRVFVALLAFAAGVRASASLDVSGETIVNSVFTPSTPAVAGEGCDTVGLIAHVGSRVLLCHGSGTAVWQTLAIKPLADRDCIVWGPTTTPSGDRVFLGSDTFQGSVGGDLTVEFTLFNINPTGNQRFLMATENVWVRQFANSPQVIVQFFSVNDGAGSGGTLYHYSADAGLQDNTWHHIAITASGAEASKLVTFYRDGQAINFPLTSTFGISELYQFSAISAHPADRTTSGVGEHGFMPPGSKYAINVRLWNSVRTQQQIIDNKDVVLSSEPNLAHSWDLTATPIVDLVNNAPFDLIGNVDKCSP